VGLHFLRVANLTEILMVSDFLSGSNFLNFLKYDEMLAVRVGKCLLSTLKFDQKIFMKWTISLAKKYSVKSNYHQIKNFTVMD